MLAIRLNTSENLVEVYDGEGDVLDFAYNGINCDCIEIVRPVHLPRPYLMIVDEEGMLKPNDVNPIGSVLYGMPKHGYPIAGTALIMKEAMTEDGPDVVSLDMTDIPIIKGIIDNAIESIEWRR